MCNSQEYSETHATAVNFEYNTTAVIRSLNFVARNSFWRASGGCFIAKFRKFRWNWREAHSTSRPPAVLGVPNSAWKGLEPFLLNSPILQKRHLSKLSSICPVILLCDRWFRILSKVSMMFNSLINIYLVKMDVFIGIWDFSLRLNMLKDLDFQVRVWLYACGKTATNKYNMKKNHME